jgi:SH3 domain protein
MIKTIFIFLTIILITTKLSASDTVKENLVEDKVLYVTDQLRLSLYEGKERGGKFIEYLISGDKVRVTKYVGPYASVITESGKEGWVKRRYLVAKLPNILLLEDEQSKNEILQNQINKKSNTKLLQQEQQKNKKLLLQLSTLKKDNLRIEQHKKETGLLNNRLASLEKTTSVDQLELNSLRHQLAEMEKHVLVIENSNKEVKSLKIIIQSVQTYWYYIFSVSLGLILIGFIISKKILEARIKKKFQGIKVW